uniref:Mei2-like C-terminal RNA recognition motif domain-containing protein n=1 Tax=Leersia perrieri TaxID=77586 RepID=A0A0D9XFZ4_9ORYZ
MPVMVYYCPPPSVQMVVYGFPAAPPPAAAPATRRCSITLIEEGGAGDEPIELKAGDEPSPRKAMAPFRLALPPPTPPAPAASALGFTASTSSLMIRNIPNKFRKERIIAILDQHCADENRNLRSRSRGVKSEYDFLYVPIDFRTRCNKGYAFVNMTTAAAALRLRGFLQDHRWDAAQCPKVCDVVPAAIQGRDAFVAHFSASWFPCHTKAFLPVWFDPPRDGVQQTKAHVVGRIVTRPRG